MWWVLLWSPYSASSTTGSILDTSTIRDSTDCLTLSWVPVVGCDFTGIIKKLGTVEPAQ